MYIYCQRIWYNRRFAQHMHSFHVLHGVLPKKRRIQSKSRQQYNKKNGEEMKHTLNLQETLWPILFFGPLIIFFSHPSHLLFLVFFLGGDFLFEKLNFAAGLPKRARATWFAFAWCPPIHWTNDFEWPPVGLVSGLDRLGGPKRWIIGINHERY